MIKNKRKTIILIIIIVLILGSLGIFFAKKHADSQAARARKPNTVDYSGPTEQDKQETQAFKDSQQKQSQNLPPAPPIDSNGKRRVEPVISYADQYDAAIEASAFVPDIFEDGGTCTLNLTHGSSTVTKTATATKNATTTRCTTFTFPAKELSSGQWTATVTYSSNTAQGTSQPVTFNVK